MDQGSKATVPVYAVAEQLRRGGRFAAASEMLEQHCRRRPDDLQARYVLAVVRRDLDDLAGAAVAIRPLLGMPQAPVQHLAGLIALDLGREERAVGRLRRALVCDPAHPGAWQSLVVLSASEARAVAWAKAAMAVDPGDPGGCIDLVCTLLAARSATVAPGLMAALATLRHEGIEFSAAGALSELMPDWRAVGSDGGVGGFGAAELLGLIGSALSRFRSALAVESGMTRRITRLAVWDPGRRLPWLGLLVLRSERARPGDGGLLRAAARVAAFGGVLEDTARLARPFEACVQAKAVAAAGRDVDPAIRIGHAAGLQALAERVGRPVELRMAGERRLVTLGDRRIAYHAPSDGVAGFASVLFLFEPGLWRWMAGFRPDDVLLDIGANVGIYTIAAAGLFGVRVAALEPYGPNLAVLRRNVAINRLADRVTVLPVAATDVERTGRLYHEGGEAGAASQHFETAVDGADESEPFDRVEGVPVDVLVERGTIPFPTRIKIDVDGNERAVIEGMTRTLADPRLHSVRLEVRWKRPEGRAVVERVESFGFRAAIDDDAKNLLFTRVDFPSKTG
ncbi:FkbM family methyltransferase [Thalassobaculum fulvum]|nr:FkbM family methyltransferase [Thalassobaculum fulvum]